MTVSTRVGMIGSLLVLAAYAAPARAAVVFEPADSFANFSMESTVPPTDRGVRANTGPAGDGDNAVFFTSRATNSHTLTWNIKAVVSATDTLKFDVRNARALGTAKLTVRVYYDGLATPHSPALQGLTDNVLADDLYHAVTVTMPGGANRAIDRIEFVITENTKVLYLDNLTLTAVTAHPATRPASAEAAQRGNATAVAMVPRKH